VSEPVADYAAPYTPSGADDYDPFAGEEFNPQDDGSALMGDSGLGGGGTPMPTGAEPPTPDSPLIQKTAPSLVSMPDALPRNGNGNGHGNGNHGPSPVAVAVAEAPAGSVPPELAEMMWEDRPALRKAASPLTSAPAAAHIGEAAREKTPQPNGRATQAASFVEKTENSNGNLADVTDQSPQHVVITLDAAGDILLLRRVYDALISHPGNDLFTLVVTEQDGRQFKVDFYNESTTHYCDELVAQLLKFVKSNAIAVRPRN
jgi:hypothetical protein